MKIKKLVLKLQKIDYVNDFVISKMLIMLMVGLVFVVLGWLIPLIGVKYIIPQSYYFDVTKLEILDTVIIPGGYIPFECKIRTQKAYSAPISVEAVNITTGRTYQVIHPTGIAPLENTHGEFKKIEIDEWRLPAKMQEGEYIIQGIIVIEIEKNIIKTYEFNSTSFFVKNDIQS